MNYFLAKTDPDTYSIDDFERDQTTAWDGVRSHQAVNTIKTWRPGDRIYIYHSQGQNAIVGLAEITGLPEPDPMDTKNISWHARVRLVRKLKPDKHVTLKQIKATHDFDQFALVRQGRLSTMLCPLEFVQWMEAQGVQFE